MSKFDDAVEAAAERTRDIARRIRLTDEMLDTATRARRAALATCVAQGFDGEPYLAYAITEAVESVLLEFERARDPDWNVRMHRKDPERLIRSWAEEGR